MTEEAMVRRGDLVLVASDQGLVGDDRRKFEKLIGEFVDGKVSEDEMPNEIYKVLRHVVKIGVVAGRTDDQIHLRGVTDLDSMESLVGSDDSALYVYPYDSIIAVVQADRGGEL